MSDQIERLEVEDTSGAGERPLSIPPELPVLPLRDTVLFPNSFMPLAVAREASVRLIDEAMAGSKLIAVFTQRDAAVEEPPKTTCIASAPSPISTSCSSCPTAACASSSRASSRVAMNG